MEQSSSQGFIQSSPYAAMNDLLFKQFGFQVLANNICKEDTDTYPILVQSVLRESDVEIWGGFRVHAYIVKLAFQKTQGQPKMSLAILLKNKFTPDVKRLGAPFQLKAYHLQWIQNVLDEDVDGMPVRNSKEIPFIAMYDAINLSEAETLTKNLESLIGSEITILLETKGGTGHHQSTMREKSHDLSPADTSQEVSSKTVDKNKQALEIFSTDLNNENERKTIKGQNQEAFADVSHDDGNLEPTADKSETCESSEDLANIPNTDTDKRLRAELSTKESNLEMNHRGHKFNAYPAITQMSKEPAAATTETQCLDTGAAASPDTNKSHHHKAGPSSDEELLPGAQSKTKSTGFKKTPSQKNKLKCQERLTRERNGTLHAELHMKEKEAKTLKLKREKKRKEKATKKFFKCEDCGIGFTLKKEYSLHMRIHKKDAQKGFQCRLCGTEFAKMIELTNHEKSVHPGEKPYVCEVCHHGFNNFMYLNGHITRAHGTTSFNCEDCDKVFKTKSALNLHSKRMHLGVWKYQCDTCSKRFLDKYMYKLHLLSHSVVRNFQCEICGKAFKTKYTLRGHMKCHSGERPHLCNLCGKGFGRTQHLREHMVVHTKKNDFLCDYCGKSFSNKTNLYVHRRQHTGVRPCVCTICGQGFHRQRAVAKHMEKIHPNKTHEPSASLNS